MCEEELQQRAPEDYPATNEMFGRSQYTRPRMDVAGVQASLEPPRAEEGAEPRAGGG